MLNVTETSNTCSDHDYILIITKYPSAMSYNLFGVFELQPFWKTKYIDNRHIGVTIVFGVLGYSLMFWWILPLLGAIFAKGFLSTLQEEIPLVLSLLTNPLFSFALSAILSVLATLLVLKFFDVFSEFDFKNALEVMKHEIFQILQQEQAETEGKISTSTKNQQTNWIMFKYYIIVALMVLTGIITGLLFAIIYFIPYFVLYFVLIFLLGNFVDPGSSLFIIANFLSTAIFYYFSIQGRIELNEREVKKRKPVDYPFSRRDIDILTSEDEPIICQNCRSFIPANSVDCPVCDTKIKQN